MSIAIFSSLYRFGGLDHDANKIIFTCTTDYNLRERSISMRVAQHDCKCKQKYRREAALTRFINIEIGNYTIFLQYSVVLASCSEYAEMYIGHRFNHTIKISSNSNKTYIPCQCLRVRNFKTIERITENLTIMQALSAVDDTLSSGYGCLLHIVLLQHFKASVYLSKISPKHSKALALILAPGTALFVRLLTL
uniref:Uncharacterized protein n=1 Tax=Glossina palpalis gambiensis TaxID=67801 RepID=A0A1B0B536_9MUSC